MHKRDACAVSKGGRVDMKALEPEGPAVVKGATGFGVFSAGLGSLLV